MRESAFSRPQIPAESLHRSVYMFCSLGEGLSGVIHGWAMRIRFEPAPRFQASHKNNGPLQAVPEEKWLDWTWQMRASLKNESDFRRHFDLTPAEEAGFRGASGDLKLFEVRTTPYYAALALSNSGKDSSSELSSVARASDPLRKILMPRREELHRGTQSMLDPLGERLNSPAPRLVHRYPDRVLFLVTDFCSVYCRYCTRKHFTGGEASFAKESEYEAALSYLRRATGIREVILSGGDPLTLSDDRLDRVLTDLRAIDHIEIIRIGSRMPVVCPMRVTEGLVRILKKAKPLFLMTHFNHPRELTAEAAEALERLVDNGIPVFNQMVLLNGVNNSAAIVAALSRRLLFLRVKPYYMFQCDPSFGTDHLRTSVEESLEIQAELWGKLSGLAMPNLSLDIPEGGGKAGLTPNFEVKSLRTGTRETGVTRVFEGWDGVCAEYKSPPLSQAIRPADETLYESEWKALCLAKKQTDSSGDSVLSSSGNAQKSASDSLADLT